ncbi:sigma-70 family RNA polymerase sigma factor [Paenibacillus sp. RC67]|uniref:RNA polymerase sigma factor n=1 Tax=Paenibacillus sp. RC67 TaxID=3039392 RepID=UPI0024ADDC1C|nr:sigma-70 family RNA polymerase sigma factor [Paenibacillus sp. RC67]
MEQEVHDSEWVSAVLEGNKEAYAFLVNRYKNKVFGLLRGMGADPQDAQDITQEAFLKAYRSLSGHDISRSFASWLYTIAANLLKDLWKRRKPMAGQQPDPTEPVVEKSAEDTVIQAQYRMDIRESLKLLPDNYRLVLLLRYTNDLSYEEIGTILDVPVRKVQNDLHRAKQRMRKLIAAEEVAGYEMLDRT